ncbi:hypothetical protein [Sphingomonas sp.]|uniref:hypothetical protein n=1 Tax=Sphingomonas sp. TaxID=28214 RepID=UPI002E304140|nr:hypothetical protein [Sphingomonas sp.]HEX4693483.1 hypothetical protein [Sphingomonas sp.]
MEIHKPKPVHGWGGFLGEVGIIVLGVLIALGAEQVVRSIEWSHKIHAAEEAMLTELSTDDGPQAYARRGMDACVHKALDGIQQAVERGAPRAEVVANIERYAVPFWTWDEFAYRAMIASDLTAHIPHDRLNQWTMAYATVPALDRLNGKEFDDSANLTALRRNGGPLSDAERDRLLLAVEVARHDEAAIMASLRVMIPAMEKTGARLNPEGEAIVRKYITLNPGCSATPAKAASASG